MLPLVAQCCVESSMTSLGETPPLRVTSFAWPCLSIRVREFSDSPPSTCVPPLTLTLPPTCIELLMDVVAVVWAVVSVRSTCQLTAPLPMLRATEPLRVVLLMVQLKSTRLAATAAHSVYRRG